LARVFCDIVNIDGTPFDGCPRSNCARVLVRPAPGLPFFVAPEIEYFYFEGLETATARCRSTRQLLRPTAPGHPRANCDDEPS